jgi:hypothetical protein
LIKPDFPRVRFRDSAGGQIMWISLFTVVFATAVGLGLGAVFVESGQKNTRRYTRKRVARARG